jgi:lipopolysaccharide/colanic/teichoic acid biosynthesis glycosyltransferase
MARRIDSEKARCDRTGTMLALVVFDLTQPEWTLRGTHALAAACSARLRRSDEVGWLAAGKLAVLLPNCCPAGAGAVCNDIARRVATAGNPPPRQILHYPATPGPGPRLVRPARDEHRDGNRGEAFDPTHVPPIPRWKRSLDIVGASLLLLTCLPLLLGIALAVKATSRGPVIFRQLRAGRLGVPFVFYKFRTMVDGADAMKASLRAHNELRGLFKMRRDPRVTRLGALLRRTSLDELPQLWNVLRGDMSLVGPRPATLDEVREYEPWQRQRLAVPQGLTGAWQVEGRGRVGFPECVRMDLRYVRTASLGTDLRILWGTVGAVLTARGAQ